MAKIQSKSTASNACFNSHFKVFGLLQSSEPTHWTEWCRKHGMMANSNGLCLVAPVYAYEFRQPNKICAQPATQWNAKHHLKIFETILQVQAHHCDFRLASKVCAAQLREKLRNLSSLKPHASQWAVTQRIEPSPAHGFSVILLQLKAAQKRDQLQSSGPTTNRRNQNLSTANGWWTSD